MQKQFSQESGEVESPCIRNCCLNEDDICLGCFRHIDEIVSWRVQDNKEKRATLVRCEQRRLAR